MNRKLLFLLAKRLVEKVKLKMKTIDYEMFRLVQLNN